MRIDAHIHGMHAELGPNGKRIPPLMLPPWRNNTISAEDYLKELRKRGIAKGLLLDPPEITFPLKEIFEDFVIPCPQVELDKVSPEDISAILDKGAVGIKFIAPMRPYGDDKYLPIYETVRDNKALAVFHTGYLSHDFFDPGGVIPRPDWIDIKNMRPAELDRINRAFPDLKILMAHFGNPWWEEAWTLLKSNKNIYADLSGGTACGKSMNMWKDLFAPNGVLNEKVVSKLCYASDSWFFFPDNYEFTELAVFYDRLYDVLNLSSEMRNKIDYENISMLVEQF